MSETNPRILVTGVTGDVGGALLPLLREAGVDLRVMCRREEQVAELAARGVEAVRGDLGDAASVRAAATGCDQLFLVPAVVPEMHELDRTTIDAAQAAGVRHVVKVSASDADPQSPVPWAAAHARSDAYLRDSGLAWTLLAATCFMSNLLTMAPAVRRGFLPGTSGSGATTWIATQDVAAAALRVLTDASTRGGAHDAGRRYLLTGTPPLSFPDVAETLTRELGRRVRYVHLPGPLMYVGTRASGVSAWQARGLVHQFAGVVRHGRDGVRVQSDELARLLSRPPTDLAGFVRQHRDQLT